MEDRHSYQFRGLSLITAPLRRGFNLKKMDEINPGYVAKVRQLIGGWLREFRKDKGLTQLEVANLLGVGEATVSKIEAGKWLSLEMLIKMSVRLDFFLFLVPKDSNDDLATVMRHRFEIMRNSGKTPN